MRKKILPVLALLTFAFGCQPAREKDMNDKTQNNSTNKNSPAVALCEFSATDSATAVRWLPGTWELRGIQTNYMGAREDEFFTGQQITEARTLTFFANGEFEDFVNGKKVGERQKYNLVGQSLTPVGYQFWFCDENTLVLNNVIADGATEVFIRQ